MGIAVPSQLRKASHQLNMALIGYSGLVLPATAGLVLVAGPPPWPSTGMDPSSAETVSTRSTDCVRRRGLLRLSLRLTMVPSVTDTELLAHGELLSPARPQLLRLLRLTSLLPLASVRPTLMPTTVMAAMVDMVPTPLDMGLAMVMAVTARGLLTLRLMPTMAMEAMVDTDSATEATAMAVLATARGQLTPRLMPTMATVDTDSVMADTAMVVLATAMARGLLMPSLTMDTVELTPVTDMVDTDLVLAMVTASKQ